MLQSDPDQLIEETRLDRLRGIQQSKNIGQYPDASHAASVLMKAVDDQLAGHPDITADPVLYHLAYRAFEALFTLHRALVTEQQEWA
ncbi:hypothetical protein [Microvirga guangxiensis]|uniref:hypothetical protein n=1 Tax=Microvirga guangxiensis TaxID=549386 RepID=UPI000B83CFE8|nr:hypothetical protein [Microvirga guangxiensis]